MNKAKSFSGASILRRTRTANPFLLWRAARRPPAKNRLLGTHRPSGDQRETTLEVNRSGTCLTRGQTRKASRLLQNTSPGPDPKFSPLTLHRYSNLRISNGNLFGTVQSVSRTNLFWRNIVEIEALLPVFVLRS